MPSSPAPLTLAVLGGGNRAQLFFSLAAANPGAYRLVAGADRHAERRTRLRALAGGSGFQEFATAEALLAAPKLADVLIVGTQDAAHFAHALAGLQAGYDLLLEKPIATTPREVITLARTARELGRRVLVCHVLRYTGFYRRVQELLAQGAIGDLVSFEATQGLDPWHHAHSYVRGHWGVAENSTPLTVANSCHDLDILSWLVEAPCTTVASFGGLQHFNAAHAPAGAPARCTDGCPAASTCSYDARRYPTDRKNWLGTVFDGAATATDAEITAWLSTSKWGRCVYRCYNTTVDHQTVALQFANGVTGSFTVTAFSQGRDLALFGSRGRLLAGRRTQLTAGCDILVESFDSGHVERITLPTGGDADEALMRAMPDELRKPNPAEMLTSLERSVESHLMGFAAEESRRTGRAINLVDYGSRE